MPKGLCSTVFCMSYHSALYRHRLHLEVFWPTARRPSPRKYWWPVSEEGHDCRILACCFLAAMLEAGDDPATWT